jgi:NADH:ubiquinone oxidoreductase subunit 3 (subunit A)
MLWAIAIIFLLLWAIGLITSTTLGGFIHVLVVVAVVLLLVRIIRGRRRREPARTSS